MKTFFASLYVVIALAGAGPGLVAEVRAAEWAVPAAKVLDQERPQVAVLTANRCVVAWEDESSGRSEIYFRLFDGSGSAVSVPVLAHPVTTNAQCHPALTALGDGSFVLAWSAREGDGSGYGVMFRRFTVAGVAMDAGPIRANSVTNGPQFRPRLATLTNGSFVVVFSGQTADGAQDVYFRRFSALGVRLDVVDVAANALGNDAVAAGDQGAPAVAALADGGFVVAYEDRTSGDVYALRLTSGGQPVAAPGEPAGNVQFRVHQATAFEQARPAVGALRNGGYVVAFSSEAGGTADSRRVLARVFQTNGPVGVEFVAGPPLQRGDMAQVIGLPSGDFLVGGQSLGVASAAVRWSVWAQQFTSNGTARLAPVQINEYDVSDQLRLSVAPWNAAGYAATWESIGQDGSQSGVYARIMTAGALASGRLSIARSGAVGSRQFRVNFVGSAGYTHQLQTSSNFANWITVYTTNSPTGAFDFPENGNGVFRKAFRVLSQ